MYRRAHALLIVAIVPLAFFASAVSAHAQSWVYDESEGGWKDIQTGLVWYDYGAGAYFTEAQTLAAQLVRVGHDDWRLPTLAEMQTAFAHGIKDFVPLYGSPTAGSAWFSATMQGKKKVYTMDLRFGNYQLTPTTSWLPFVCVRQGTPE